MNTIKKIRLINSLGKTNIKKLKEFSINNITPQQLNEIQILYNEHAVVQNNIASIHNKQVLKNRKILTLKVKELRLNIVNELKLKNKKNEASKKITKFIKRKINHIQLVESTYKSYFKYIIPARYHEKDYDTCFAPTVNGHYYNPVDDHSYSNYYRFWTYKHKIDLKKEEIICPIKDKTVSDILNTYYFEIKKLLQLKLEEFKTIRFYIIINFLIVLYGKPGQGMDIGASSFHEESLNIGRVDISSIQEFNDYFSNLIQKVDSYDKRDSAGYSAMLKINDISINILKYRPLQGSSYQPLPDYIQNTGSIVNIKNTDDKCFLYSVIASRYPTSNHPERVKQYLSHMNEFNYQEEDFPMKINNIKKFEKHNSVNINVYTSESKDNKYPLHISKEKNKETISLYLFNNHYSLIKNFSRFCGGSDKYNCPYCLKKYGNRESYSNHIQYCQEFNENGSFVTMPEPNTFTYFTDFAKQKKLPIVLYADFESSLQKSNDKKYIVASHIANSYRIKIVSPLNLGDIPLDYEYIGENCDIHFVTLLSELNNKLTNKLKCFNNLNKLPILSHSEELSFQSSTLCSICNSEIGNNVKVRDHCHFSGKYLGAACRSCNLCSHQFFKGKIKIPIYFHNSNYDIKQFISAFSEIQDTSDFCKKMTGVPCNMQIYKVLNFDNISITDSYAHLTSSLSTLIENLPDSKKIFLKTISGDNLEKFKLINKKGFYPYEFVDHISKLDTPIQDLKRSDFDSKLMLSKLTDSEWDHIQNVIKVFNFKTLKEWHELYLKIDVFGLADVFEYYRELSFDTYGLDPAHYIGLPSYTWAAGLKETQVKLQNIDDSDLYMMFEKMKRGGVSVISHRHAKANNKYLPDYDTSLPSSFIYQVDANNLYGWAMSQKLPLNEIQFCTDFEPSIITSYSESDYFSYILECDLDYPIHLHDSHNDYPLMPEHYEGRLSPNLFDKKNYILHIDNLQYYLSKGIILKKIHRVVKFHHEAWLKPYIEKNSKLRQNASNEFEKDFYKLMNNSFYGKTMENIRDRIQVNFCLNKKQFDKHTNSPLFANQVNIIKEDGLTLVKSHKKTIVLNKPIYLGACILDLSKIIMYKFHYDVMKVRYPDCIMMKTDTDSLLYFIKTEDLYKDLKEDSNIQKYMEFSNYPKDHYLYNCDRKKEPGLFQDEIMKLLMALISEYVGLRAKCYSLNIVNIDENNEMSCKKKAKGVPSRHVDKKITFDDYKTCLLTQNKIIIGNDNQESNTHDTIYSDKIYSFRSINMKMYSIEQSKIALSSGDTKRYILKDKITTLAWGHYKIPTK